MPRPASKANATVPAQSQPTAAITTYYDVPAPEKLRSITIRDGQSPTIQWTMCDDHGCPVDLTTATGAITATLNIQESLQGSADPVYPGTVVDAAAGLVAATINPDDFTGPGIYYAEFAVSDQTGAILFSNRFYLVIERSLFKNRPALGPPGLAMIRLQLRDSSPAECRLIDTVWFDDAEIAAAIERVVDYWNDSLPPLDVTYSTQNFPFRYWWVEGTIAILFRMAAEYYRKNHLPYQAGGLAIDDFNKAQEYEQAAQLRWQQFTQWAQSRKMAMNLDQCYGRVGSPYGWGADYGIGW
jgi:hypothetical protein